MSEWRRAVSGLACVPRDGCFCKPRKHEVVQLLNSKDRARAANLVGLSAKIMTGKRAATLAALAVVVALRLCALARASAAGVRPWRPRTSGRAAVATLRSEPGTFNRFTGQAFPTYLVSCLTQARLVRINRLTHAIEPWLADRWTRSPDGRRYELHLRDGVQFSDGHPFTTDDVLFSFRAATTGRSPASLARRSRSMASRSRFERSGPVRSRSRFPHPTRVCACSTTCRSTRPTFSRRALAAGTFNHGVGTDHAPGRDGRARAVRARGVRAGPAAVVRPQPALLAHHGGRHPLPFLDRLTLEIVPDQNAELLRLQAGQVDLLQSELRPEDYVPVKREADAGRARLVDVGRSLESHVLWFNLRPRAGSRAWLRRDEFRRALSHAVDRADFVRAVYLGAAEPAWGPVAPANTAWFDPSTPTTAFDAARSAALLAGLGFRDTDGDRLLEDATGAPVRFTVLVQKGISASEKGAAVLRERFAAVGVGLDVVPLDLAAIMTRWMQGDYDAIYHLLSPTDTDPAGNLDFWLSNGSPTCGTPGSRSRRRTGSGASTS